MARKRKGKLNIKPVLSAFIWGVLTGLGLDPGRRLFATTADALGPYFQIAAVLLLFVVLYFSYDWIVDGLSRSRKAFRTTGPVGIAAIVLAFLAEFFVFAWDKAAIMLLVSALAWMWATLK
jgi:membrane-anchored protein YejM (alkaline phosphatase superfamily)